MDVKREQYVANGEPRRWAGFIGRHPLVFTLLMTADFTATLWFTGLIAAPVVGIFSDSYLVEDLFWYLFMSVVFAGLLLYLGWWRSAGFTPFGEWRLSSRVLWLPVLWAVAYFAVLALLSDIGYDFSASNLPVILIAAPTELLVGFEEEVIFRGVILFGLLWAWREKPRGVLWAVLLSSALFGLMHAQNTILYGSPVDLTASQVCSAFLFGLGMAGLVLATNALWPAVIFHAVTNLSGAFQGLYTIAQDTSDVQSTVGFNTASILFNIPLGIYGLYVIRRRRHRVDTANPPQ